ncbi:MAG TPA: calcium/proton exchanger [Bacillales bacterium]|nr:calcium/proton exchanger [Bacillales bacterium]
MKKTFMLAVITLFPLSVLATWFHWPELSRFVLYGATIISLAFYMSRATENLSILVGERIGGLINATFGNAVELLIAIFSLKAGLYSLVLASISGSVIGNLLFNGGLSFFTGGLKHKRLQFNVHNARHNSALLIFAVIVAFLFPKIFSYELAKADVFKLSLGSAVVMIFLYLSGLYFKLVTHRGVYSAGEQEAEASEKAEWGFWRSLVTLLVLTAAAAYVSENLVETFDFVSNRLGLSEIFIGLVIVAVIGNAGEYITSIMMAAKNRVAVTVEISVGATLQIAMFVAPVLVFVSLLFGRPLALIFTMPEMASMVLAVLLNIMIMNDGDTNWFEGATLVAAYAIMAVGFYLL